MLMFICFQSGKQLFIYIDTSKLVWIQAKKQKCSDSARSKTEVKPKRIILLQEDHWKPFGKIAFLF